LRDGLKRIRQELGEHFADDLDDQDMYCKQMWSFASKANEQVEDLVHDVNNAESTFIDVISYYGEDEKKMTSSEFYGIFKTFVTSYKVRLLSSTKAS
jgi:cytokinesis protein